MPEEAGNDYIKKKGSLSDGTDTSVLNSSKGEKMDLIISLIVYLVVFGLIWWLISMLPLPAPVAQIVRILFIILLILMVLSIVGILPGGHLPRIRL
jgi:ABC-type siderophore export system fused ATPase/permease subunit